MRPKYRITMSTTNTLVGYVRKAHKGEAIKVSINVKAFEDCKTYTTSDGDIYVPLIISANALNKVQIGERVVTTIIQQVDE